MGLLKTGLKAVVAVKTADVIHERVLARQEAHAAAQGHPLPTAPVAQLGIAAPMGGAPVPPALEMEARIAQLKQLGELRDSDVLTDAEFAAQKAQILSA
jgi:Short C-terminal domain